MNARSLIAVVAAAALLGCAAVPEAPREYAHSRAASDFDSYHLRRVGLLPFRGVDLDETRASELQQAFAFELGRVARFELVALTPEDVAEIRACEPLMRGAYEPRAVLALAERFRLDGLVFTTVTQMQAYAPQALALELELVPTETAQPIWVAGVALDTADPSLRATLEHWNGAHEPRADAQLAWLSPQRLARFAACAVADTL